MTGRHAIPFIAVIVRQNRNLDEVIIEQVASQKGMGLL
jgi:hypothetical protein